MLFLSSLANVSAANGNWTSIKTDDLSEWSDPSDWWKVENGVFVGESTGGKEKPNVHYLIWDGSIKGDFEISLKYRIRAVTPQDAGFCFLVEKNDSMFGNLSCYQAELDTAYLHGQKPI
ncbi:DUF1080 domain-containing protein [Verrucomicrobia bacterium]|nr:DUF1080 domain-containing protein [Verrucomicrobiota bacterium]